MKTGLFSAHLSLGKGEVVSSILTRGTAHSNNFLCKRASRRVGRYAPVGRKNPIFASGTSNASPVPPPPSMERKDAM